MKYQKIMSSALFITVMTMITACNKDNQTQVTIDTEQVKTHKDSQTVDLSIKKTTHEPTPDFPFINEIPDYTQTHIRGEGTGNGLQYCGPVAVSNSLMWLTGNRGDQEGIILQLASKPYMNTRAKSGTSVSRLLQGADAFVTQAFGGYKKLQYEGWRPHRAKYSTGRDQPSEQRLKTAINKKSAVWLNIGWYTYNSQTDEYTRVGGHFVTLVGYAPPSNKVSHGQFIIHDPAPRAGNEFANDFVSYSLINSGSMVGKNTGLPVSAKGFIKLEEGLHKSSKADVVIVDGAVFLQL